MMEYRFMGRTGLKVSDLCLGTQTFGWGADEATAHALADRFVEAGGNFFDTFNIYNQGEAESICIRRTAGTPPHPWRRHFEPWMIWCVPAQNLGSVG